MAQAFEEHVSFWEETLTSNVLLRVTFFSHCIWPPEHGGISASNPTCSSHHSTRKQQQEVSSCDLCENKPVTERYNPGDCRFWLPRPRFQAPSLASAHFPVSDCAEPPYPEHTEDRSVTPLSSAANFPSTPVEVHLSRAPWKQRQLAVTASRDNAVYHCLLP